MIIALLTIAIGLFWLLKETKFLRIRLPVGAEIQVKRDSWDNLKRNAYAIPEKQQPMWLKHPDCMTPLCGLDWLENTMHVIPETKVELVNHVHKYTIKSDNANALRDAFRVYRNPYLRVKLT